MTPSQVELARLLASLPGFRYTPRMPTRWSRPMDRGGQVLT